ncbi:hypothetical protein B0H17DRAFT_960905 [Mycena rosella]|uniref:Uncharacterized protein n=1 Tax=Mycena rosella TaxID=1033263 RepID=A0AAD7C382_MYCRO|nr:hypothetical protein B0H17DRAFT_960905 [Mycena rosella]
MLLQAPALSTESIIYSHIKAGGYNGDQFLLWLEGLAAVMNPYPAKHSVLVSDWNGKIGVEHGQLQIGSRLGSFERLLKRSEHLCQR